MLKKFTACYQKLEHGYMGSLLEWPGGITEGDNLEDCRELLMEAANEMAEMFKDDGMKIPYTSLILEPLSISVAPECLPEGGRHSFYVHQDGRATAVKRHNIFDRISANKTCKDAGLQPIF